MNLLSIFVVKMHSDRNSQPCMEIVSPWRIDKANMAIRTNMAKFTNMVNK